MHASFLTWKGSRGRKHTYKNQVIAFSLEWRVLLLLPSLLSNECSSHNLGVFLFKKWLNESDYSFFFSSIVWNLNFPIFAHSKLNFFFSIQNVWNWLQSTPLLIWGLSNLFIQSMLSSLVIDLLSHVQQIKTHDLITLLSALHFNYTSTQGVPDWKYLRRSEQLQSLARHWYLSNPRQWYEHYRWLHHRPPRKVLLPALKKMHFKKKKKRNN